MISWGGTTVSLSKKYSFLEDVLAIYRPSVVVIHSEIYNKEIQEDGIIRP